MDSTETSTSAAALRCWVEGRRVWLELADQWLVSFPAAKYPLLAEAPQQLLEKVQPRVQGRALRWEDLDEDIWVDDAVHGRFPKPQSVGQAPAALVAEPSASYGKKR
jgi:hypothetical protein